MLRLGTAGLFTTVQDLGRRGHQREGVPAGGAMDRLALRVGNLLVGNDDGAAALETTLFGPTITFDQETLLAVTGGDAGVSVNDRQLPMYRPVLVPAGATLHYGREVRGCRSYLAIAGGIDVPRVFGSRSTYTRGAFGGCDGRALRTGDRLPIAAASDAARRIITRLRAQSGDILVARWSAAPSLRTHIGGRPTVRLLPGAHLAALDDPSRDRLFGTAFRVGASSDRMGYRLEGATLSLRQPLELLSEAVAFGTVQLPPGGQPIILMADRQTVGGYPRLGELASVDLPTVAQLRPGDSLHFAPTTLDEAQRAYLRRERELEQARVAIALL